MRRPAAPGWSTAWWVPVIVHLLLLAAFLAASPHIRGDFPLDDAWIHRVYARALAEGDGPAYNPGRLEAGMTSPLWVVITAPLHWLERPFGTAGVVLAVKAVGGLLGAAAVVLLWLTARRLGAPRVVAAGAATLLAVEPRLLVADLSGMETSLLVALWFGVGWALVAGRLTTVALLAGLLTVTRPETALVVPLVAVAALWRAEQPRVWLSRPWPWLAAAGPGVAWLVYCKLTIDHWLPTTFYVKSKPFTFDGAKLGEAWSALVQHGWLASVAGWAGLVALVVWLVTRESSGRRPSRVWAVTVLLAPPAYLFGVVGSRVFRLDGYYWTRWSDPAAIVVTGAAALGLALMLAGRVVPDGLVGRRGLLVRLLLTGLAVVALAWSAMGVGRDLHERRDRLASDSRNIRQLNVAAGEWIRDHTPADATIACNDAGAVRYFGGRRTLDLMGLNTADIAFARMTVHELIERIDYLAVFPSWFGAAPVLELFETRAVFRVEQDEYTICDCPGQNVKVVAVRRGRG